MSLSQCRSLSPGLLFLFPCSFSTCHHTGCVTRDPAVVLGRWLCRASFMVSGLAAAVPSEDFLPRVSLLPSAIRHPTDKQTGTGNTPHTKYTTHEIHHTRNTAWWKLISESDSGQCNARVFIYYVSRSAVLVSISMSIFISISICVFIDLKVCEIELYCH